MSDEHNHRVNQVLRAVRGDEEDFNRIADAERLGVYLRRGRLYPAALGQAHTSRLAGDFLLPPACPVADNRAK